MQDRFEETLTPVARGTSPAAIPSEPTASRSGGFFQANQMMDLNHTLFTKMDILQKKIVAYMLSIEANITQLSLKCVAYERHLQQKTDLAYQLRNQQHLSVHATKTAVRNKTVTDYVYNVMARGGLPLVPKQRTIQEVYQVPDEHAREVAQQASEALSKRLAVELQQYTNPPYDYELKQQVVFYKNELIKLQEAASEIHNDADLLNLLQEFESIMQKFESVRMEQFDEGSTQTMLASLAAEETIIRENLGGINLICTTAEMLGLLERVKGILDTIDSQDFSVKFVLEMAGLLKDQVDSNHRAETLSLPTDLQDRQRFFDYRGKILSLHCEISDRFEGFAQKARNAYSK